MCPGWWEICSQFKKFVMLETKKQTSQKIEILADLCFSLRVPLMSFQEVWWTILPKCTFARNLNHLHEPCMRSGACSLAGDSELGWILSWKFTLMLNLNWTWGLLRAVMWPKVAKTRDKREGPRRCPQGELRCSLGDVRSGNQESIFSLPIACSWM